jgi:citrate synthase
VADTTAISMVNEATNSLLYRGYPVDELASLCSFEEVAYLILYGELPTPSELAGFEERERSLREIPGELHALIASLPKTCHPMDVLRTAVSYLGAIDDRESDNDVESNLAKSIDLFAKLPTIVAAEQRRQRGEGPVAPDRNLGFSENFLKMSFGSSPSPEVVRCFEVSLTLYAEHSFNASTFTARVIISTLSDIYSAVVGAIGALKGPLHGGANEAVMHMFEEIGEPQRVDEWLEEALASHRKIMGFGHRVYKHGDSRVPTMLAALEDLASTLDDAKIMELYGTLADAMFNAKSIYPNLDYPSGPAYYLMGFDIPIFTPIFVISRITGWTAHIMEQLSANSLIRPLSVYAGEAQRSVPPRN